MITITQPAQRTSPTKLVAVKLRYSTRVDVRTVPDSHSDVRSFDVHAVVSVLPAVANDLLANKVGDLYNGPLPAEQVVKKQAK
jgi:hypothetical protein